jgi:multiple sugar transport system permease protein
MNLDSRPAVAQGGPAAPTSTQDTGGDTPPRRERSLRWVAYAALFVVAAFSIVPFTWVVLAAFDSDATIFVKAPTSWTLGNFVAVFRSVGGVQLITNSLVYAGGATILLVITTTLAGYAFSRYSFPGRRALMLGILMIRIIPPTATIVPLYVLADNLGLLNTYHGLILILAAMEVPLAIWIMKGFFDTVPIEIEEAAWMDGASRLQAAFRIVLPLAGPGVGAAALIGFMGAWNQFLVPLVLISDQGKIPISIGLFRAWVAYTNVDWGLLAALSVVYILPALVFYIVARRVLQQSLAGGLAGT